MQEKIKDDTISRQAALDAISCNITVTGRQNAELVATTIGTFADRIKALPSAQPENWMERNKERILQAGMEGREIEFRIGGRLFAIREKVQ